MYESISPILTIIGTLLAVIGIWQGERMVASSHPPR